MPLGPRESRTLRAGSVLRDKEQWPGTAVGDSEERVSSQWQRIRPLGYRGRLLWSERQEDPSAIRAGPLLMLAAGTAIIRSNSNVWRELTIFAHFQQIA